MSLEEAAGRTPQGDGGCRLPEGPEVILPLSQARLGDKNKGLPWVPSEDWIQK